MSASRPIEIGANRQLFVDRYLIDELRGLQLKLHPPVRREKVIAFDRPWEGPCCAYPCVLKDGDLYRMWYRATPGPAIPAAAGRAWFDETNRLASFGSYTSYAESRDGVHWEKPSLGLTEFQGSKDNNLVDRGERTRGGEEDYCVFKDPNPGVPADERFKSIIGLHMAPGDHREPLFGIVSADGLRWRFIQDEPIVPPIENEHATDGPHTLWWDPWQSCYVIYRRGWWRDNRTLRRTTSSDFRQWSAPEFVEIRFGADPREQFYTSATTYYQRAPGLYLMFPKRFIVERKFHGDWPYPGQSDIGFLTSRDGIHWERTFREAFVRPGLDPLNWHERSMMFAVGILETSPTEHSMYLLQNFRTPEAGIWRTTLRPDGFASVNAPEWGGELVTQPLVFAGRRLYINYSTSALGSVRVEILNSFGRAIDGFRLSESTEIFGDEIERAVTWGESGNVSRLAGETVRLRFVMRDADLFSFRFG